MPTLRPRTRTRILHVAAPLTVLIILVICWSVVSQMTKVGVNLFPSPTETAKSFWQLVQSAEIWRETAKSWRSLAIGFGISVVLGIFLGLLLGVSRLADKILGVYLDISLVTPMVVMMPIVLMALGITVVAEVIVVILFAVPYVTLPIRNSARSIPKLWLDLSHVLCATKPQAWRYILFPGVRHAIVHGLRLGLAHALGGLLVVEFTLVAVGIGKVVIDAKYEFDFAKLIAYVLFIMIQVMIVMAGMAALDRERFGRKS